jgi:hypothetical protein
MDIVKNIQKARAKLAENRQKCIRPLNPIEKAKQKLQIKGSCYSSILF